MVQSDFNINDLFKRYFLGRLEDSEYKQLTDLLKQKENLEKFEKYKKQWGSNLHTDNLSLTNWKRLNYRIADSKRIDNSIPIKKRYLLKVISYAAILIIGLMAGGVINYFLNDVQLTQQEFVFETPRGEKSKVTLPDGSEVWLNAKSRLAYKTFKKQRLVDLQGEAFFNVKHDSSKPFTVVTPKCNVEVLGTSFNVMAYDEFGRNEVTLIKGSVKVYNDNQAKLLSPNQVAFVEDGTMKISKVESETSIAWVSNKFNFNDIPLSELIKRLENWYDIDIDLKDGINSTITFTGVFKNEETVWQVLDALKVYLPINYKRTNTRRIEIWIKK